MAKDIRGNEIRVGSKVKILNIDPSVWEHFPEDEKRDIQSMIGEVFEVHEVSDELASVEKWWRDNDNCSHSHSIALHKNEMELTI